MAPDDQRRNNFDLVRLAAAGQVLWVHTVRHLDVPVVQPLVCFDALLRTFPGVPAFFVVSGFLITEAWLRAPDAATYARNRVLRVYPALWACLALSVALAVSFGHGAAMLTAGAKFPLWLLAQATVVQVWNPDFLRGFGVGVLNGSLWTIPVELQFYAALPLLLRLPRGVLVGVLVASAALHAGIEGPRPLPTANRVLLLTLAPHLFCFGLGVLACLHRAAMLRGLGGRFLPVLLLHLVVQLGLRAVGLAEHPLAETLTRPLLAAVVLSAAFTVRDAAHRVLRGHDISYGLYLVHMPVLNAVIAAGGRGSWPIALAAMAACHVLASLSWIAIERPALRRKRAGSRQPAAQPG
jgi:peptidoglycan/LPS O-acetylase OafA/YrhL